MDAQKKAMLENVTLEQAAATTIDGLLDKRVTLEQPAFGYRVAMDTVLLAAAVPAQAGEKVLDLGCGVGGAMLCLAVRVPGVAVTGVEIQAELVQLCRNNISRNKITDLNVQQGDATKLPSEFSGAFHHVIMNPPYHDETKHDVSSNAQKRTANTEKEGDLALWIENAARALRPEGTLTLIHRADRFDEIVRYLPPAFGKIEVCKILPKAGVAPKRIVVRAYKDAPSCAMNTHEFVLHQADGRYTDEAENILRHGAVLAEF